MTKKPYAICIPLNGKTLKFSKTILNYLDKKYSIKFINNKNSRPHINLFSGTTSNVKKILKILKKNLKSKRRSSIEMYGFGAFLNKSPIIFLRFEYSKHLKMIRKLLFKNSDLWTNIEKTVDEKKWLPKSTLIHEDININCIPDILRYLSNLKQPKIMPVNEITIIDFSSGKEKEITNIKI